MPRYPDVEVQLTGHDGNAFMVIGRVCRALDKAGYKEASKEFAQEAMSGDYDHLLRTAMDYVEVH